MDEQCIQELLARVFVGWIFIHFGILQSFEDSGKNSGKDIKPGAKVDWGVAYRKVLGNMSQISKPLRLRHNCLNFSI